MPRGRRERYVLRIKEPNTPSGLHLARDGPAAALAESASREAFERAAEGWYYDAGHRYLWVRFATDGTAARLTYRTTKRGR